MNSVLWSLVVIVAVSPGIVAAILPLSFSYYIIQVRLPYDIHLFAAHHVCAGTARKRFISHLARCLSPKRLPAGRNQQHA